MLSVEFSYCYTECYYAECSYAECYYAEWRGVSYKRSTLNVMIFMVLRHPLHKNQC
jgi:hypothetical protein